MGSVGFGYEKLCVWPGHGTGSFGLGQNLIWEDLGLAKPAHGPSRNFQHKVFLELFF